SPPIAIIDSTMTTTGGPPGSMRLTSLCDEELGRRSFTSSKLKRRPMESTSTKLRPINSASHPSSDLASGRQAIRRAMIESALCGIPIGGLRRLEPAEPKAEADHQRTTASIVSG
ncbi:hypothetical protein Dimus_021150, partial [Dionaea muscipula]